MKFVGNVLWFLLTGLWTGLMYLGLGVIWCITIIGIPFGLQIFKLAKLSFWPFGTDVEVNFGKHAILNVLWFILGGFIEALALFLLGILWCITIIGIPFGKQCFKLAKLSFAPFGAEFFEKK